MREPTSCCCHAPDARECFRSRYGVGPDQYFDEDDGSCECVCHTVDQDGYSEWDDPNEPPPGDYLDA